MELRRGQKFVAVLDPADRAALVVAPIDVLVLVHELAELVGGREQKGRVFERLRHRRAHSLFGRHQPFCPAQLVDLAFDAPHRRVRAVSFASVTHALALVEAVMQAFEHEFRHDHDGICAAVTDSREHGLDFRANALLLLARYEMALQDVRMIRWSYAEITINTQESDEKQIIIPKATETTTQCREMAEKTT